jgi:hypothetical protein
MAAAVEPASHITQHTNEKVQCSRTTVCTSRKCISTPDAILHAPIASQLTVARRFNNHLRHGDEAPGLAPVQRVSEEKSMRSWHWRSPQAVRAAFGEHQRGLNYSFLFMLMCWLRPSIAISLT